MTRSIDAGGATGTTSSATSVAPTGPNVTGAVVWERAALVRESATGTPILMQPLGRILKPAMNPFQIADEEVPRTGVRVARIICRSRGSDGSTHLWVARRKLPGSGEGSSGLSYDIALPLPASTPTE